MALDRNPVLRRWDGKAKVATTGDNLFEDSELTEQLGDCNDHPFQQEFEKQKPAFVVSFANLRARSCLPLILQAAVNDTTPQSSHLGPIPSQSQRENVLVQGFSAWASRAVYRT